MYEGNFKLLFILVWFVIEWNILFRLLIYYQTTNIVMKQLPLFKSSNKSVSRFFNFFLNNIKSYEDSNRLPALKLGHVFCCWNESKRFWFRFKTDRQRRLPQNSQIFDRKRHLQIFASEFLHNSRHCRRHRSAQSISPISKKWKRKVFADVDLLHKGRCH